MPPTKENLMHFVSHVKGLTKKNDEGLDGFDTEYKFLSGVQAKIKETIPAEVGRRQENYRKNRYKDIVPYDPQRVVLNEVISTNGIPVVGSDYINASFIKDISGGNGYIAAMGPMSTTVCDFWRMIWQYEVQTVVMLCNEIENGKKKCAPYGVSKDKPTVIHGDMTIEFMEEYEHNSAILSTVIMVTNSGRESKVLRHFHFRSWPDHGVPTSSEPIVELIQLIRDHQPYNSPPIVVHCSAGCGRTGTVIAVDYAWQMLENGSEDAKFYLPDIVAEMRRHRISLVQTKEQYVLIYRSVLKLAKLYMRKKKKQDEQIPEPVPMASEDLYGNMSVQGVDYGHQVTALQPKSSEAPGSPCFTVRVDRGEVEDSDNLDHQMTTAAASTGASVYEKEAELLEHDHDDEQPPELPCRTAQSNVMEDSTYQMPSPAPRTARQQRPAAVAAAGEDAPPSVPVRTQDSYHLTSESSRSDRGMKQDSSSDATSYVGGGEYSDAQDLALNHMGFAIATGSISSTGSRAPLAADYSPVAGSTNSSSNSSRAPPAPAPVAPPSSEYSSIGACMPLEQTVRNNTGISSSRKSSLSRSARPVRSQDSINHGHGAHPRTQVAIAGSTSPRLGRDVGSGSKPTLSTAPSTDSPPIANKLGLKRGGKPKGPRPPPAHWRSLN